jgi:hypothetical protein
MADMIITAGDTRPVYRARLTDADDHPISLVGAEVRLRLISQLDGTLALDAAAEILVEVADELETGEPNVQYVWQPGDTLLLSGIYYAQWRVTDSTPGTSSYPNKRYAVVQVVPPV